MALGFDAMDVSIERSYASKGHAAPASGGGEEVMVEGTEGTAFLDGSGALRIVRDGPGGRSEAAPEFDRTDAYPRSYAAAIAHFVDGLRTGAPFETSLEDNLRTLTAVFAAYRSIETAAAVDLSTFRS